MTLPAPPRNIFKICEGMLPISFPDDGSAPTECDYDNDDRTFCYFEAVRAYYETKYDLELLLELYLILQNVIAHHCKGTHFGIRQTAMGREKLAPKVTD